MQDTLTKLPNELPNTDEPESIAATLIVAPAKGLRQGLGGYAEVEVIAVKTSLKPVWFVDFYRGRPEER